MKIRVIRTLLAIESNGSQFLAEATRKTNETEWQITGIPTSLDVSQFALAGIAVSDLNSQLDRAVTYINAVRMNNQLSTPPAVSVRYREHTKSHEWRHSVDGAQKHCIHCTVPLIDDGKNTNVAHICPLRED